MATTANAKPSPVPSTQTRRRTNDRTNTVVGTGLGSVAKFADEKSSGKKQGSLASDLIPSNGGLIDVVGKYRWTLSNLQAIQSDVPYVYLTEYRCNESQINRSASFYTSGVTPSIAAAAIAQAGTNVKEVLSVYNEIMPKDNPTGFSYKFPFFSKNGFELLGAQWQDITSAGEAIKSGSKVFGKVGEAISAGMQAVDTVATTAALKFYPSVGVVDRPKVYMSHSERTINISFTLFNTVEADDWNKNRDLAYLLMSQNLFNKRDYVTGVPPVFYDVFIPGQYYSYASALTDLKVEYIGNQRLIGNNYIVPDAYEFILSLTELTKPSRNQFEAISNGAAQSQVRTK